MRPVFGLFMRFFGTSCESVCPLRTSPVAVRLQYIHSSTLGSLTRSLRVIGHTLQGFAEACKSPISKLFSILWVAECCTVLRSRWYQMTTEDGSRLLSNERSFSTFTVLGVREDASSLDLYSHWIPSVGRAPPKSWTKRWARLKLLLPSASPWGSVGTQPQGDVSGLYRLSHHSYEVAAQGVEVCLVPELGREGF